MSSNQRLAELFETIARMMDLLGEDSFRTAAFAKAGRAVADQSQDVTTLAVDKAQLLAIPGIGKSMADRIVEFSKTGTIADAAVLAAKIPPGLLELTTIPGVGAKSVRVWWQDGNITNLTQLRAAIDNGSLAKLPRMGEKSVAKIKENLSLVGSANQRTSLGKAAAVADIVVAFLLTLPGVERAVPAGSLRRGKETIGDIDVLVALKESKEPLAARQRVVAEAFRTMPGVVQVIALGENKSSVRVGLDGRTGRWKTDDENTAANSIQVDLRILPNSSFGAGMMYFTGSKEHNVRLRERALKSGWTLSEWGLFPNDDHETPPHTRGVVPLASVTEEEVYAKFGLPWIPPELREDRGELELTAAVRLIEVGDIKAELHAHTTASDGNMEIEELASRAKERGFHTIAVTDHSKGQPVAGGLTIDRLLQHIEAIAKAREVVKGIRILAGSEVDILADGTLDYPDDILRQLEIVVASPHNGLNQDPQSATKRMVAAIRNPLVHIVGHPTGRLVTRRNGLSPDMGALLAAAKECNTALEINAHWMRLDLRDIHVKAALEAGCLIAINCDVHAPADFDNLRFGVTTGRRGGLTPERCINTWDADRLWTWLRAKR